MRVRGYFRLLTSKAIRRGREISVREGVGTKNFVARSWLWMIVEILNRSHFSHLQAPRMCFPKVQLICYEQPFFGYCTTVSNLRKSHGSSVHQFINLLLIY